MVASNTRKIISLAISLLVVVISLTSTALGATVPNGTRQTSYPLGAAGEPGKMVRDAAGSFYVTDFWGKGIIKLNNKGEKVSFIPVNGRPSAVAVLPDSRLVIAISKPTPKIAFYSQATREELASFGAPAQPLYNPTGIAVDPVANYIYVVDSGDVGADANLDGQPDTTNFGRVRVYSFSGEYKYVFGARTVIGTAGNVAAAGSFKVPLGIAYEKVSGNIVVADTMNQRLQFFNKYTDAVPSCTYVKTIGDPAGDGKQGALPLDDNSHVVKFGEPADIAFEYNDAGTVLNRIYVAERGKGNILVINPPNNYSLKRINGSTLTTPDANLKMVYPSGIVFEKTTNSATSGILYVSNAAESNTANAANILAFGIDGGTVPSSTVTMTMNNVPVTSSSSTITVSGSTTPSAAVSCSVNGGTLVSAGSGSWSAVLSLTLDKTNYILCQTASGGAYTEANTYYGAGTAAPFVYITEPAAGLYTSSSTVTVKGTTTPGSAMVQLVNSLGGTTTTTQSDAAGNWSKAVTLSAGSNLLTATASKDGTAASAAVQVTVVADFTPPSINVSFLSDNAITNNAVQNIDGIVNDDNLLSVEVNEEVVPTKAIVALNDTDTYFSTPVILSRGKNFVTIKATDRAGLTQTITRGMDGSAEKPIMLKPEIPGMTVALPADNSYRTAAGAVTASGTVDAVFNSVNAVNACGTPVTPSNGNWSTALMAVTEGFLSCQFTASATGVDTVAEKRTINTGTAFAEVSITLPSVDYATKLSSVTISGTVPADPTPPQISINGAGAVNVNTYTPGTGAFSHDVTLSIQGVNSYKIIAPNRTTAVRNIIFDKEPPVLTVQADTKTMPLMIYGTIEPSSKMSAITASLDGANVPIPVSAITFKPYDQSGAVSWTASLGSYVYDKISFTALDPAGNSTILPYAQGIPTGDIDGDGVVRLADALAALRHVAGTELIDPEVNLAKFFNGDVGGLINGRAARDGMIDITDSVLILNKAYGLLTF